LKRKQFLGLLAGDLASQHAAVERWRQHLREDLGRGERYRAAGQDDCAFYADLLALIARDGLQKARRERRSRFVLWRRAERARQAREYAAVVATEPELPF